MVNGVRGEGVRHTACMTRWSDGLSSRATSCSTKKESGAGGDAQQQQAAVSSTFVIDEEKSRDMAGNLSMASAKATIAYNAILTPPPNAAEYLDADYDGEPVHYRLVNDVVGPATPPGLAARELDEAEELLFGSKEEPPSYAEAEKDAHRRRAMEEEMNAIEENGTWELVEPPPSCRPISLKWVYKVKRDERGEVVRHKARLVARGFVRREGVDFNEVFAPVARMESVRLLRRSVRGNWNVHHMDVKSAFLNGDLKEEVYVKQPPGYVVNGQEHRVLRPRKALYGLSAGPEGMEPKLDTVPKEMEFKRCESEHALYTRRASMGSRWSACTSTISSLERSGMGKCRPNKTPMEEKLKPSKDSKAGKVDATSYRSIVGGLRYLVHTRPDLAFAVGYVSRFMAEPRKDHQTAVRSGEKANLSDSDMGGDIDGRRSTSGMLFFLGGGLSHSLRERRGGGGSAAWLGRLLREVTGEEPRAPVLRVDNNSAIELAKNPVLHDRSKHIDIRFHYIRECVAEGQVVLGHVDTAQQLADLLTKPLGQRRLAQLMVKIGVEEHINGGQERTQGLGEEY
ncbi:LOW QUALITY PROTEIN: hypothetical protein U9M48_011913 [Paspalum notatum var. saurae]|uniref:Reverse transcriptase Ty1/copia-type domain-containing protein n=2 Tax=Paspalum notatum var. saurae TaxID=547442 RepID=A0AAQ3SWW1_PASNO